MNPVGEMRDRVTDYFGGDASKMLAWFQAKNPTLGDVSPNYMIAIGRVDRLRRFIEGALSA